MNEVQGKIRVREDEFYNGACKSRGFNCGNGGDLKCLSAEGL